MKYIISTFIQEHAMYITTSNEGDVGYNLSDTLLEKWASLTIAHVPIVMVYQHKGYLLQTKGLALESFSCDLCILQRLQRLSLEKEIFRPLQAYTTKVFQ